MEPLLALLAGGGLGLAGTLAALNRRHPELLWDWSTLDTSSVTFPSDFLWGTATAAHQVEGGNTGNNWSRWETLRDEKGRPRVHNDDRCGAACEHFTRYPQDMARMRDELGMNAYRFSIEWSRIEPARGRFDPAAIAHYHQMIDAALAHGLEPMVTLHHFTHPLWFEELGSFEREENIAHILRFTELCLREYGDKVPRWCTFNEPGPFSVMGWALGVFPPGKKDIRLFATVLRNLLVAHLRMVQLARSLPCGNRIQIGLVKNIFQLDPYRRYSPLDWLLCRVADQFYNEAILTFLREGVFHLQVPGLAWRHEEWPEAKGATDFIGLNYYANLLLDPFMRREPPFETRLRPGQTATDMPYAIYAEGFYRAIKQISTLNKPIYITENGVADAKDDGRRAQWISRYLYAMRKAMDEGADVRGFYYWSFMDNFEWAEGYAMRFGLYEVDYATQERRLRAGAAPLIEAIRRSQGRSA